MNFQNAQSALDDIHRLQDRTREEILRQSFALPYVLIAALGLFVSFGSGGFDGLWSSVAQGLGLLLYAGVGIVREHRASVRRKVTVQDVVFHIGLIAVLVMIYGIARVAVWALFGLPSEGLLSQGTAAAAVMAVAYVALTPINRRVTRATVALGGGRG
ncbi:hypothetical protein E1292_19415 [Nonomuraea deserti]|uniref:Uncharacterized protein n=1 Tax=Nonomuraea deserti TaxID=1848322 RepID=A0A4R4VHB0_9ACTN|nr:hypothetical protein [Nonomuraea deserti]TDD04311.1 hypothetical protein E1292_19415 [Nonomuraea deserti]